MKIALAMIVKGTQEEADTLSNCLTYTSEVDGIFLTFTHKPGEQVHERCFEVARLFNATVSTFEWCNDFSKARNFNFSQVPKDFNYILWLDADDAIRGLETLKPTIEQHPEVDAFSMFYLYAFDDHKNPIVVHTKTRVVKNDGCVEWAGQLHEDFKENRTVSRFHIKGIEVLHLSNTDRFNSAKERNLEIAEQQLQNTPDDPRSMWNVANAAFACLKLDKAIEMFDRFLLASQSDDEKYLAYLRKAEGYGSMGKLQLALDSARYALGTKPQYPDAYILCGKLYYEMGKYELAKDMFLNGLVRPVPYYSIIVYNPRDYDYVPLMALAKTYYALNLPQLALPALEAAGKIVPHDESLKKIVRQLKKESKEGEEILKMVAKMAKVTDKAKLSKLLDKVPAKFKFHPEVLRIRNTNFVKETSSGKDMVVFCGHTEEVWNPKTVAKKGSGGSEEAIITLTEGLAKRGWNVTVYNNCGTDEVVCNDVTYRPYLSWNYRDKQDVTIIWRNPGMTKYDINSAKVFVDMHDVIPEGEFTQDRLAKITKVFFKSQWHRQLFPSIPDEKCVVIPNGIQLSDFPETPKDPNLIINTASPVRSLTALIKIMKKVRSVIPEAKLQWAYGWTTTDYGLSQDNRYSEWKAKTLLGMKEAGIEHIGRLTYKQVAELYNKASVYAYPTGFPEIDCISLTKALAAGCVPVTTDYGAMKEKAGHGGEFISYPENKEGYNQIDFSVTDENVIDEFAQRIIHVLQNRPDTTAMREYAKQFDWENIINQWEALCG